MMFIALDLHSHQLCFKYQKNKHKGVSNHLNPKLNASSKAKSIGIKVDLYIEYPGQLNLVMSFFFLAPPLLILILLK